jgi:hypothetical protein
MWYNISSANGNSDAAQRRKEIENASIEDRDLGVSQDAGPSIIAIGDRRIALLINTAKFLLKAKSFYDNYTTEKMTSAEILKAQKMARECMNSNYQNCGW